MRQFLIGLAAGAGLFIGTFSGAFALPAPPTEQFCEAKHAVVWAKALEGARLYGMQAAQMKPEIVPDFLAVMQRYDAKPFPKDFAELWLVVNPDSKQVVLAFVAADGCTAESAARGPFSLDDAVAALSKVGK